MLGGLCTLLVPDRVYCRRRRLEGAVDSGEIGRGSSGSPGRRTAGAVDSGRIAGNPSGPPLITNTLRLGNPRPRPAPVVLGGWLIVGLLLHGISRLDSFRHGENGAVAERQARAFHVSPSIADEERILRGWNKDKKQGGGQHDNFIHHGQNGPGPWGTLCFLAVALLATKENEKQKIKEKRGKNEAPTNPMYDELSVFVEEEEDGKRVEDCDCGQAKEQEDAHCSDQLEVPVPFRTGVVADAAKEPVIGIVHWNSEQSHLVERAVAERCISFSNEGAVRDRHVAH